MSKSYRSDERVESCAIVVNKTIISFFKKYPKLSKKSKKNQLYKVWRNEVIADKERWFDEGGQ
ncbi:MAG: hypothetical protein ACI9Y8_002037 [Candidatus Omnitrophota bacterium]|jgi:hypothetical protein